MIAAIALTVNACLGYTIRLADLTMREARRRENKLFNELAKPEFSAERNKYLFGDLDREIPGVIEGRASQTHPNSIRFQSYVPWALLAAWLLIVQGLRNIDLLLK